MAKLEIKEFDKNYYDEDYDCCKCCGYEFDSYEKFYSVFDSWSAENFFVCEDCMKEIVDIYNKDKK